MFTIIPLELDTNFAEGSVNAFIVAGRTVTLVDTGNPGKESYQQLSLKLHKHDISIHDIDKIVLTHIHIDHAGGVSRLQAERDLPIFVHEQAEPLINITESEFDRVQDFFQQFLLSCGANPAQHMFQRRFREEHWRNVSCLRDGGVIPLGGVDFEVVHVPGHSQSDILLWNRDTGETIAGDHLLKDFSVNAFIEPPGVEEIHRRPKPLLQFRQSLERVSKLPLSTVYPGHGKAFTDHVSLIKKRLHEQERRCEQILQILSNGKQNIYQICTEMYPHLTGKTIFLGLSQIQGHLDLLEKRQQVSLLQKGPTNLYHVN